MVAAGQAQGDAVGHGGVPLDEELVSIEVALLGPGYQVGVSNPVLDR